MPNYSVYGSRDDRVAKDGDIGFVGFNNRLRPDQLAQGMLADAQNIRLDRNNEAQPRFYRQPQGADGRRTFYHWANCAGV